MGAGRRYLIIGSAVIYRPDQRLLLSRSVVRNLNIYLQKPWSNLPEQRLFDRLQNPMS